MVDDQHAAVFENDLAPPGWCEIQRDDESDKFATDEDAAVALAFAAGMPHTAMQYNTRAKVMIPVHLATQEALEAIERDTDPGFKMLAPWIAVVPVEVAIRTHLIDAAQAARALEEWT